MRINRIELNQLRLPLARQRISLTDANRPDAIDFLAVTVHADNGLHGLGFTYTSSCMSALRTLVEKDFTALLIDEDPLCTERLYARFQTRFRSAGWSGLVARAYAAIDIALWDLKGKATNLSLAQLFGGARSSSPVYLSDIASLSHDPAHSIKIARPLIEEGVLGVLVEVGNGDVQLDADRVQQLRDGLGEDAWLGISVEGRYDLGTALAMAHFYEEDVGIDRFESPLPADDLKGYRRLAERMEVSLALGNTFESRDAFLRLLEAGDIRVLRPDILRLGGITPFLKIAALAENYPVVVSPYRLPEIGVHLACGLANIDAVEYTSILSPIFENPLRIEKGKLVAASTPGHGLLLSPEALKQFAI